MSMRILRKHKKVPVEVKVAFRVAMQGKSRAGAHTVQDQHERADSPEQELWRDVIARLALDALGITGISRAKPEHQQIVREAQHWFWYCYDDMQLAFEFAALDFDHVVETIRETLNEKGHVPNSSVYVSALGAV